MPHIHATARDATLLFPPSLDEYITDENPVRFIDAFVEQLDLQDLGFTRTVASPLGRPAYHPGDLLKLYIYGYLNRLRSSRLLEREAQRNIELIWLLKKLTPDFKTIADFRKDNLLPLQQVCRTFTLLCKELDLFGGELVAVDGSKFKAVNNRKRNFTPEKLTKALEHIDAKIAEYLQALDTADSETPTRPDLTAAELHNASRSFGSANSAIRKSSSGSSPVVKVKSRSLIPTAARCRSRRAWMSATTSRWWSTPSTN
jgi:transposase